MPWIWRVRCSHNLGIKTVWGVCSMGEVLQKEQNIAETHDANIARSPSDIYQSIFSAYSYANLTPSACDEISRHLKNVFSGCHFLHFDIANTEQNVSVFQAIANFLKEKTRSSVIVYHDHALYYAQWSKEEEAYSVVCVNVPGNEAKRVKASNDLINTIKALSTNTLHSADSKMLRAIRQVCDVMRFHPQAVQAIFDTRVVREGVMLACDGLFERFFSRDILFNYAIPVTQLIPDEFEFYSLSQVDALEQSLRLAIIQYLAQAQAAEDEIAPIKRPHAERKACYRKILLCLSWIDQLHKRRCAIRLSRSTETDHTSYLGDAVDSLCPEPLSHVLPSWMNDDEDESDVDYFFAFMTRGNWCRLFWLWSRCLIEALIIEAHEVLLGWTIVAVWASWLIYGVRGGEPAAILVWIAWDDLVTERARVIQAKKRVWAYWCARYDDVLNDLIWGGANLAGCFWLTGPGLLGFVGDVLTLILLGMDLLLAVFRWRFGDDAHKATVHDYNAQLEQLYNTFLASLNVFEQQDGYSDVDRLCQVLKMACECLPKQQQEASAFWRLSSGTDATGKWLETQRDIIQHAQELLFLLYARGESTQESARLLNHWQMLLLSQHAYMVRWQSRWWKLNYDVLYAIFLGLAFALAYVFPVAGLALFGVALLSGSTVLWRTAYAQKELSDLWREQDINLSRYQVLLQHFRQLANVAKTCVSQENQCVEVDAQMKQVYLQIRTLGAKAGFDQEYSWFQLAVFFRATALRFLVPTAIAMTVLFAPVSVVGIPFYVFVLLGVLMVAIMSMSLINAYLKPQSSSWKNKSESGGVSYVAVFDEEEYGSFKHVVLSEKTEDEESAEDAAQRPLLNQNSTSESEVKQYNASFDQMFFHTMQTHRVSCPAFLIQRTVNIRG